MPDTKISAMTPASIVHDADILPIVQGGNNLSSTRALMLTSDSTTPIKLQSPGHVDYVDVDPAGAVHIVATSDVILQSGGGNVIHINISGFVTIVAATVTISSTGGGSTSVSYVTGTPGNWGGMPPTDMAGALDRIAAAVAGLLGGPIP